MRNILPIAFLALGLPAAAQPAANPGEKAAEPSPGHAAVTPADRKDGWWVQRHDSFNRRAEQGRKNGDIPLIFLGDSITQGWEQAGRAVWEEHWAPLGAVNFGISGDRTQHVLWRLDHGNVDGLAEPEAGGPPRLVVLMIGTNNSNGEDHTAAEIAEGVGAVVGKLREKLPTTRVLVLGIFPRGEHPDAQREKIREANERIARLADGKMVHYLDIGGRFTEEDGSISAEIMPDFLHLSERGYEIWAEAIKEKVEELTAAR